MKTHPSSKCAKRKLVSRNRDIVSVFKKLSLGTYQERNYYAQFSHTQPDPSAVRYITHISGGSILTQQ